MAAVLDREARSRSTSSAGRRARRRSEEAGESALSARVIADVREQIRRRGLDPFDSPTDVSAIVDAVLNEHDQASARTGSESFGDLEAVRHRILDAVAGFGVLQPLLDDDSIEEVWINGPERPVLFIFNGEPLRSRSD